MSHHVGHEYAHARELHIIVAGHFIDQRALAVYDLIMRDRQQEVLGERIEEGEGDGVVMIRSPQRIEGHIGEHVVHPAHVPLVVEAKTAVGYGTGYHRPGGGFLSDHHNGRMMQVNGGVQSLDELDRLEVLVTAVLVGDPLAVTAVVVEVQHGGYRVNADAVDMVLVQPEHCGGYEEGDDLVARVVEYVGAPFLVLALAAVLILIAVDAVEASQTVSVLGEVSGYPVEDDADAFLVALVDEVHEHIGRTVAGGGSEVAGNLITPGAVKRILGHGHELDVGVAHLLDIGDQLVGELVVIKGVAVGILAPGACVNLIDVEGVLKVIVLHLILIPSLVVPLILVIIVDDGSVVGAGLGMEREGIGLEDLLKPGGLYAILIDRRLAEVRNPNFPNAAFGDFVHVVGHLIPSVKVADNGNGQSVGSPYAEHGSLYAVHPKIMGAEEIINAYRITAVEQIKRESFVV